jgi:hypothetical protein
VLNENHSNELAADGSAIQWLPFGIGCFFCVRSAFTLVLVRVFSAADQFGAGASLCSGFVLLALVGLDLLRPATAYNLIAEHSGVRRWVILYVSFAGISLLWSLATSIPASFAYWSGMACDVAMILLMFRRNDPREVCSSTLRGFVFGTCVIAVAAWLMPSQYDLRLGDEDYLNANTIANLCAFGIFLAQCLSRTGHGGWRFISALLALTLVRSLSKSTIAAFAISAAFMLIRDRSLTRKAKLALTSMAFVVILLFWGLFEAYYDVYTTTGNQAETLTGRTAIWAYAVENLPEHLWIGHGFDSMWKTVPPFGTFEPRHAENELLQQLYCYGLVGAVMMACIYGSFYRCSRRLSNHPARVVLVSLLLYVLVRGIAEAEPFDLLLPMWMILLLSNMAASLENSTLAAEPPLIPALPAPFSTASLSAGCIS